MSAEAIVLPGDIPGLLRRGAPVVGARPRARVRPGLVMDVHPPRGGLDAWTTITMDAGDHRRVPKAKIVRQADLSLDLRDEAGADRALRWLAGQHQHTFALHGWRRCPQRSAWAIEDRDGFMVAWDAVGGRGHWGGLSLWFGKVPALASIPLDDPDADLLALRAVVLHVAGRA
jgi:hypothetical protein